MRFYLPFMLAGLGLWAVGCQAPQQEAFDSTQRIAAGEHSPEQELLWQSIQATLRDHYYTLDRVDTRGGVITTKPESSQHLFEFWRRDVATFRDFWEASLNPIGRWIEVMLTPAGDEEALDLSVAVHKQRLSAPDRQFNSSAAAYQFFGDLLPATTGEPRVTAEQDRWIDLGRDSAMERRLLDLILERSGLKAADD